MPILTSVTFPGKEPIALIRFMADEDRSQTRTADQIDPHFAPSAYWERTYRAQRDRRKLESFASLHHHLQPLDLEPPNEFSITSASLALELVEAAGLSPANLSISMDGGVAMSFVAGHKRAFLEFCNSEEIVAACYSDLGETVVWQIQANKDDLSEAAKKIRVHLASK